MLQNLTTTETLASLIGLYFLTAGIGLLTDRIDMAKMFDELNNQPLLGYIGGIMAFAIGGAVVAVHNDWSSVLAGIVSLLGWFSLAEGVLMLACRRWYLSWFGWLLSDRFIKGMGLATTVCGVALLVAALGG